MNSGRVDRTGAGADRYEYRFSTRKPRGRSMIDITAALRSFNRRKQGWPRERTREIATAIHTQTGGEIAWDDEAGECWARIIVEDKTVVMICACGPLLILKEGLVLPAGLEKLAIPEITVTFLEERILRCDKEVIIAAFKDSTFNDRVISTDQFSADELWFVTV